MDKRVALIGVMVDNFGSTAGLNEILHDASECEETKATRGRSPCNGARG